MEIETIDMTEMDHERDLWGPKAPWVGSQEGSPLNNFLARTTGRRAIVLLDEFEKTSVEVRHSLLVPFREGRQLSPPCSLWVSSDASAGKFTDRRNRRQSDCSKIIWIITSNALDPIIVYFTKYNKIPVPCDDRDARAMVARLQGQLEDGLKENFGVSITHE